MSVLQKDKLKSKISLRASFWVVIALLVFSFSPLSTKIYEDIKKIQIKKFFQPATSEQPPFKEVVSESDDDYRISKLTARINKPLDKNRFGTLKVTGLTGFVNQRGQKIKLTKFDVQILFKDKNKNIIKNFEFDQDTIGERFGKEVFDEGKLVGWAYSFYNPDFIDLSTYNLVNEMEVLQSNREIEIDGSKLLDTKDKITKKGFSINDFDDGKIHHYNVSINRGKDVVNGKYKLKAFGLDYRVTRVGLNKYRILVLGNISFSSSTSQKGEITEFDASIEGISDLGTIIFTHNIDHNRVSEFVNNDGDTEKTYAIAINAVGLSDAQFKLIEGLNINVRNLKTNLD